MNAPRKLAAILATDVAGYSRLMGADEAGTARALREHRAAIDPIVASGVQADYPLTSIAVNRPCDRVGWYGFPREETA
jgi:hypothetical protein